VSTSRTDVERPAIVVGVVTKPHGLRGDVAVQNRSDNPDRWSVHAVVFDRDGVSYVIREVRSQGTQLLVRFEGVDDRSAAEVLRGRELLVPESWLPTLPEGEWWPHQIEGCAVVTERGRDLGVVTEVIANPANDLWVAVDDAGVETLIPALADLLQQVDVVGKRIVVRDVPGLTVPDEPGL
jgi:16S rRNA processing protein RimM